MSINTALSVNLNIIYFAVVTYLSIVFEINELFKYPIQSAITTT